MKNKKKSSKDSVEQYMHASTKRSNNPPVGLVTSDTDPDQPKKKYLYDPRLDPQLQWSGKTENSEFEVDTVSLHVHERIDPHTILEKTMKAKQTEQQTLFHHFDIPENNLPLRNAIEFYQHDQNWSNRLIAGDSLLVMNSLLEKEGMEGKVQMIYIDPPYGIKYGSNFQPFVNKRDVKDGKDEDLTQEPEMIRAFRDTWELGIHSYLTYLRDRLILSKNLLSESGSIFVQISDENLHHVREIMDEVFGTENFVSIISFEKTTSFDTNTLSSISDYLIWYAKDIKKIRYQQLFKKKIFGGEKASHYNWVELSNGVCRKMTKSELKNSTSIPIDAKIFAIGDLRSSGFTKTGSYEYEFENTKHVPPSHRHWKTNQEGMNQLKKHYRLIVSGKTLMYKRYLSDFPVFKLTNHWGDAKPAFQQNKIYVVQTIEKIIERCILMTTEPGQLVLDLTCGSGTTALVAEQWGRRWMTCDTSRIAIVLAKQRLMTAKFDYYQLLQPHEGVSAGFEYETVPHVTLSSVANDESPRHETLYDRPLVQSDKTRISGPFTVEAVPSPIVQSIDVLSKELESDLSPSTPTNIYHQQQWRDELLETGIRGKGGQKIEFSKVESHPVTRWLHADAETKEENPKRVMVSFGPEHAPLEQRQVENAIEETRTLVPKPEMIIFTAMQFDPEAAKDIDELNWPGVTILKVEMNKDLLTEDLKKKRSSSESFWLMGQPDVELEKTQDKKYLIKVNGFDYYNTKTGEIESGGSSKIAMWMLDTDYDGRSVYPQQVFFPMSSNTNGGGGCMEQACQNLTCSHR